MTPTVFTSLGLAINILSVAGQKLLATIFAATTIWVPGSFMQTGNHILLPDASTTTAPGMYLKDESTPLQTYPLEPDTEHCYGHTGALLCEIAIKLTGSGGHQNNNAGSWTCTTYSCAVLSTEVYTESVPVANDALYIGWTNTPETASGSQFLNRRAANSGALLIGSGALAGNGVQEDFNVPPGATVKAVWTDGDGTEDHSTYEALWITRYRKFWTP